MPSDFRLTKKTIDTPKGKMAHWVVTGNCAGTTTMSDAAKAFRHWSRRVRVIVDIRNAVINSTLAGQLLVLQNVSNHAPFLIMSKEQQTQHREMVRKVFRKSNMRIFTTLKGAQNAK